jgi:hypothetical protein
MQAPRPRGAKVALRPLVNPHQLYYSSRVARTWVGVMQRAASLVEKARGVLDPPTWRALAPALVFVGLLPMFVLPIKHELGSALFRDAMMCQYSAWCIRHGVRLYDEIAAPDGPFIHFLHALFQVFVGIADRGCRKADLVFQILVSGTFGAVLAPAVTAGRGRHAARLAWAALGIGIWLSYYLSLGVDHTVQRDPYFALVGYLGMTLVFVSADASPRAGKMLAFAGGFVATLMVFSRPFGVIYPAMAGLGLLIEMGRETPVAPGVMQRVRAAAAGAGAAFTIVIVAVAIVGSLSGLVFWYLRYPLAAHRFIGRQNPWGLLTDAYAGAAEVALTLFVGIAAAMATGLLPWRAVGFALAPGFFLFSACWTGKGWSNHVIQVNAAAPLVLLLGLSRVWGHRAGESWSKVHALAAFALLTYAAQRSVQYLVASEFSKSGFENVPEPEPLAVAAFLKAHTQADDRVFLFGHEARVLLVSERVSAIPYYVNMIFDIATFMRRQPPAPGEEPAPEELAAFERFQKEIAVDACGRLSAHFPAAMVFEDNSLATWGIPDGVDDVAHLCPDLRAWLRDRYTLASTIGSYHVYLRKAPSS